MRTLPTLAASVGRGGINRPSDVALVNTLFDLARHSAFSGASFLFGRDLISNIVELQRKLGFQSTDGRIDPDGRTFRSLLDLASIAFFDLKIRSMFVDKRVHLILLSAKIERYRLAKARQVLHKGGSGAGGLTDADYKAAAASLGPKVEVAMIRAFAEVESGGKSGFGPDGRPIIAFEGHRFRRETGGIYDLTHPSLSYRYKKKAGPEWQENNKDQSSAWKTLAEAIELNSEAALKSSSWGMFQIMGDNYKDCGFDTVDAFVDSMKANARGQLDAFVGFCKKKRGLVAAISDKDFVKCATIYNGEDYGDYDKRIERSYKKYAK